ncbi:MAG TPA: pitrilysin family protein [Oligoflexus sp.]|uniref:M16 family metallopeptidase n=1 Tax=Oligoflexus sp. TaxID=1971216 RepID=UPI002D5193A7|nr:pitrilysin family protein [Oligoflexus sp.]HYX32078.1 pitrilysin family protein [Oligoflexus sp.]
MKLTYSFSLILSLSLGWTPFLAAKQLVSDATIAMQKQNTEIFELPGKVPVVYRRIEGTEIVQIATAMAYGEAHVPAATQPALSVLFELMKRGTKTWPKDKLYALVEKYAASVSCGVSIETSACSMATLEEYLPELLPVYASVMQEPAFDPTEGQLILQQAEASLKSMTQNPEAYVNEVVNGAFYGGSHPYWVPNEKELEYLKKLKLSDLPALHADVMKKSRKVIVVVAGMPKDKLQKILTQHLGQLTQGTSELKAPPSPKFNAKRVFALADRDIPTAYVRAKFSLPPYTSPDTPAVNLLMRILSEELESEVRTKRSLSYAVFAQPVSLAMGIGVIHASTSHPKETLEAIAPVVKKLRDEKLSKEDLERHKTVFATGYFLTLEEHSSLASALASSYLYNGNIERLYQTPRELEKVTPEDIQRIARQYFKEFRLGVVFKEKSFQKTWADGFLKALN